MASLPIPQTTKYYTPIPSRLNEKIQRGDAMHGVSTTNGVYQQMASLQQMASPRRGLNHPLPSIPKKQYTFCVAATLS